MAGWIWYLWPEWATYWWQVADKVNQEFFNWSQKLVAFDSQPDMLDKVLRWNADVAAAIVAYSNNLWPYGVEQIWEDMTRFTRTIKQNTWEQRLHPKQLWLIVKKSVQQCLIWNWDEKVEYSSIKKIYGHRQALNQTKAFIKKCFPDDVEKIECESNWAACIASGKDPINSVAIWPEFSALEWQVIHRRWIDNNTNSQTSFALIRNPNMIGETQISEGDSKWYWAIVYAKHNSPNDWIILPILLKVHWMTKGTLRASNSPSSGKEVFAHEILHHDKSVLWDFLLKLKNRNFRWKISVTGIADIEDYNIPVLLGSEIQYLGPCPTYIMQE